MDLVADRDCVIDSITVRKGTVQVKRGEKVKKGTVLVSGQVPVLNDAKEVTGYQYHQADADITGITTLEYEENCEEADTHMMSPYSRLRSFTILPQSTCDFFMPLFISLELKYFNRISSV